MLLFFITHTDTHTHAEFSIYVLISVTGARIILREYQRATVTTVTDKESGREIKSDREREREGGVCKRSENRDRDRQRNRERHAETEIESFTTVFLR